MVHHWLTLPSMRLLCASTTKAMMDSLVPPTCLLCGELVCEGRFCTLCETALTQTWPPAAVACRFCAMPRPREPAASLHERCNLCKSMRYGFDEVIALAIYQGAVREAVVASKLARHYPLATSLGWLLGNHVRAHLAPYSTLPLNSVADSPPMPHDIVTYVPTHFLRRIHRKGLSGAAAIASEVGQRLELPAVPLLRMTRAAKKQSMLLDAERPANVRGAFAIKKRYARVRRDGLKGLNILLVDDVLTTGSTASEIARILKDAGAGKVTLAVVARAVRR
jgi:predicted amidophosphoribosyltransferase